ncbi:uncharacterized protein LOC142557927 [Dermacentor variabilis]|uniref:uncharacterized protein LOC142557927 n=1 Tax=Dermacentor variabilis TaxID=34621 RepID=UPI003F5C9A4F
MKTAKEQASSRDAEINALRATVQTQAEQLERLQVDMNESEQYSRNMILEIHGLPENENENLKEVLSDIAEKLHIQKFSLLEVWTKHQNLLFEELAGKPLLVAGDGRADSPGHSAKYGTYSLIDIDRNKVFHVETVQSNETKGSSNMELEGLKRSLTILEANGMVIDVMVTDRHSQIKAFAAKEGTFEHNYDCWHVAKSLKKKLPAAGKLKKYNDIQPWIKGIINHVYWCAVSSEGRPDLILPKWCSLARHIADAHCHDDPLYEKCQHDQQSKKKWLIEGSPAHEKIKSIILNKVLLKDIPKLSTSVQTFAVEAYHGTIIRFAPKATHFHYQSIISRTRLAALHYNENSAREHATTKGQHRYLVKYPKSTKVPVAAPIKKACTYVELCMATSSFKEAMRQASTTLPPTLSSNFEPVDKDTLVSPRRERFNQGM